MKAKKRKQLKRTRSTRHELRAVHAKRRPRRKTKNSGAASSPWLRMVPTNIEDEPGADVVRGFLSNRNGRRQPRDLDLYIPEDRSRTR